MTHPLGLITTNRRAEVAPTERLLGTPLVLWAVNNLRRVLPLEQIAVVSDDPAVTSLIAAHGLREIEPTVAIDAEHVLIHDAYRPFCAPDTIHYAIKSDVRELEAVRVRAIERIDVRRRDDLELASAVAAGLPPNHPCIVGVRRMRLPLDANIKAVITDVDGVLTDGRIHVHSGGEQVRAFHMQDGLGSRLLQKAGIAVGWLSAAADDGSTRHRAARLDILNVDVGEGDKGARFTRLCEAMNVDPAHTLYVGDDVNDLPAMERAALAACPANARPEVKAAADLVLDTAGGDGAFRELVDILLDDGCGAATPTVSSAEHST